MERSNPHGPSEADARVRRARENTSPTEPERSAWRRALLQAELRGIESGFITATRLPQP
jgi:hypothetical protein